MSLILSNANIHTSDPERPHADTIVIDGEHIAFVGAADSWDAPEGSDTVDLGGRTIVAGFVDAHAHPAMISRSAWHTTLPWTHDAEELLEFVRRYAAEHPRDEAPYLYFEYYPSTLFPAGQPTKELLDRVVDDRPVLCTDFSDHEHWVNSRMLELMGVTARTPDPIPGLQVFVRDEDGEPTGLLREFAHLPFLETMYDRLGWRPPEHITPELLAPVLDQLTANGVTAVFEAILEDDEVLAAAQELDRRGELDLYYEGAVVFRELRELPTALEKAHEYHERYGGARIRVRTLKLMLDGTNESGNSAVLEPLCRAGNGHELGEMAMSTEELTSCLLTCNDDGTDLHVHLVGDRSFRSACDAVAAARTACAATGTPWRTQVTLAHCELVDPADMHRPAELGIIVNWTPHWSGGYFGEEGRAHLGDGRWNRMYRFTEFVASGATLTFGSDTVTQYEAHRGSPLFGMQVAATRVDPEFPLDASRYPRGVRPPEDAGLGPDVLLRGHTLDAARQLRLDDRMGSLTPGKLANLVVLGEDPLTVDPSRLSEVTVDAVVFEGTVVAGSLPFGTESPAPSRSGATPV
ncbi:amidohydrolase family protein [Kineococcus sp. NBC_00420]|uniref:amidohydrolase n=1 Tax=Kineococcus sp. NBC_00420 TaxID=2903564 RepID=UPI002E207CF5